MWFTALNNTSSVSTAYVERLSVDIIGIVSLMENTFGNIDNSFMAKLICCGGWLAFAEIQVLPSVVKCILHSGVWFWDTLGWERGTKATVNMTWRFEWCSKKENDRAEKWTKSAPWSWSNTPQRRGKSFLFLFVIHLLIYTSITPQNTTDRIFFPPAWFTIYSQIEPYF